MITQINKTITNQGFESDELDRHSRNFFDLDSMVNMTVIEEQVENRVNQLESAIWANISEYRNQAQQYTQGLFLYNRINQ